MGAVQLLPILVLLLRGRSRPYRLGEVLRIELTHSLLRRHASARCLCKYCGRSPVLGRKMTARGAFWPSTDSSTCAATSPMPSCHSSWTITSGIWDWSFAHRFKVRMCPLFLTLQCFQNLRLQPQGRHVCHPFRWVDEQIISSSLLKIRPCMVPWMRMLAGANPFPNRNSFCAAAELCTSCTASENILL